MKIIKRKMLVTNELATANDNIDQYLTYCQSSINSDGNITLRNYDRACKEKDEIIILSERETMAIIQLMAQIHEKIKDRCLPF